MPIRSLPPGRLGVLAASPSWVAERFFRTQGVEPALVLDGPQILAHGWRLPKVIADAGIEVLAVHAAAWARTTSPHLYEFALATAPVEHRVVIDEETGAMTPLTKAALRRSLAVTPVSVVAGAASAAAEVARHAVGRARRPVPARRPPIRIGDTPWVLALWSGAVESQVGGAVTHISGILNGFRAAGFEVAVASGVPAPAQLAAATSRAVTLPPSLAGARVTPAIGRLTANADFRTVGTALGAELQPRFVYQRHGYMLRAGPAVARRSGCPLVLEWNGSEVWARNHWTRPGRSAFVRRGLVDPVATSMEREVAAAADLVVAISERAAEMALEAGAHEERVVVVPNGVDLAGVPAPAEQNCDDRRGAVLGWIGSFGPWHGADVLVRSLSLLPDTVSLLLIGDGPEREACGVLAASLGVAHRIEWTGTLPHELALQRLSACDILVSPHVPLPGTPFFGSPTKLFEYMALGRPIVASRLEQIGDLFEHGRTAHLVTPGAAEELAAAVLAVLRLPDRGRGLGANARAEAACRHTWERRARAVLEHLGEGVA